MARSTSGWTKSHRKDLDSIVVQNIYSWAIWKYLESIANYKESEIVWDGKPRKLEPGQCLLKVRELSDLWKCSPATIWKWMHVLSDAGYISIETRTRGTIVTICNWKENQAVEELPRTPSEHQVNTARTPSELYKEVQNGRQEESKDTTEGRQKKFQTWEEVKALWLTEFPKDQDRLDAALNFLKTNKFFNGTKVAHPVGFIGKCWKEIRDDFSSFDKEEKPYLAPAAKRPDEAFENMGTQARKIREMLSGGLKSVQK